MSDISAIDFHLFLLHYDSEMYVAVEEDLAVA